MITIDREGAARLLAFLQCDGLWNPKRLHELGAGIESAAAGDFTALAALTGTREVERATDIQPDFRADDIISVNGIPTMVQGRPISCPLPGSWAVDIAPPIHGATCVLLNAGVKLTHRRHFKAGERCGTVAVGQRRTHPRLGDCVLVESNRRGLLWSYSSALGDGTANLDYVQTWPLAADYSAPEAVEVKP